MPNESEVPGNLSGEKQPAPASTPAPPARKDDNPLISHFMARFGAMSQPSLIDKATPEQLDKLIDQADRATEREDRYRTRALNHAFWIAIAVLILVALLCWMFLHYQKSDALQQIVTLLVGLGGGGTVGFGIGRASAPKSLE